MSRAESISVCMRELRVFLCMRVESIPVYEERAESIPVCMRAESIPVYERAESIPVYERAESIPVYES